jgi:hypothetical protein
LLTVSRLSKSFAGRALFDDVSPQVNRVPFADYNASTARHRASDRGVLGLLPATVGDTDAKAMSSLLVIAPAKGNRIIQILSAINYRFLGPNSR